MTCRKMTSEEAYARSRISIVRSSLCRLSASHMSWRSVCHLKVALQGIYVFGLGAGASTAGVCHLIVVQVVAAGKESVPCIRCSRCVVVDDVAMYSRASGCCAKSQYNYVTKIGTIQ